MLGGVGGVKVVESGEWGLEGLERDNGVE